MAAFGSVGKAANGTFTVHGALENLKRIGLRLRLTYFTHYLRATA